MSTAKKVWTRLIVTGLAACTVAALAAPASGQTLRRDGSKAVSFVAAVSSPAGPTAGTPSLRRDGSQAAPFAADLEPDLAAPAADGFDWGDAAVGAGAAIALVALGGAALVLRGRRVSEQAPVQQPGVTTT